MTTRQRYGALALAAAALLAACGTTTTTGAGTTTGTGSGTLASSSTAPTTQTPGTTAGTTPGTVPDVPAGVAQIKVITTPYGAALGRGDGKVLYAWDKETGTDATCTSAACVEKWPPLLATDIEVGSGVDRAALTLVARPDGTQQVAINGRRLYAMALDEPGEANCQGAEGWFILHPDGSKNANETATS